jgi:anti-sigma factor RsiW
MSGMTEHPELLLSAYLDDALSQGEHELVRAHLDECQHCRAQLADLRATSRLIGGLPQLEPRRSLVPRLERAPVWLRPVRLLGVMGSGLFVFLFIASAVVNSGASLGGGTSTAEQLAEKGQFGAAINALASDAAKRADSAPAATAAPAPVPAAAGAAASQSPGSAFTVASPTPIARDAASSPAAVPSSVEGPRTFGPPPQVFLLIAVLLAIAAFVAHRRLHRA